MHRQYNHYQQLHNPSLYNEYGYTLHPIYYNWDYNIAHNKNFNNRINVQQDFGPQPFAIDIEKAAKRNSNFRTTLWTGNHLQVTLMNIGVGEDIGLEIHPTLDQFLRVEDGKGLVQMGINKGIYDFQANVSDDYAIMIPAGTWHNLINTGNKPLKLYSIYAPPEHVYGTIHETKAIAIAAEKNHHY